MNWEMMEHWWLRLTSWCRKLGGGFGEIWRVGRIFQGIGD